MAKKRKKTSFWTIALTAVVTAGAALGAIKLFGVPSELRPEGEVHLKVINKVTADELIENSIFSKSTQTYDSVYLTESFDYYFDDDTSRLFLSNITHYSTAPEGLPESTFAKSKRLTSVSGAVESSFWYIGDFVSSVRINYLDTDEKESSKYAVISEYKLLKPGDFISKSSSKYVNITDYNQYAISFTNFGLEEGEELISIEALADLDSPENQSLSEVDQVVKSFAKVSFRNDKESEECTITDLENIINKDKKILKQDEDNSFGTITNGKFTQGGLMFEKLVLSVNSNCFDFIKLTVKGHETKVSKGYEESEDFFSARNCIYCASNILDTSKAPKETEAFWDNTVVDCSCSTKAVLLDMEFFTIEKVK